MPPPSHPNLLLLITIFTLLSNYMAFSQSSLCRTHCGQTPINYPFGIDNGCGNPHFQNLFLCDNADTLLFRTPSGNYPVTNISYTDPHFVISNPFMWSCDHASRRFPPSRPFSLDASKPLTLSPLNNYLFFNCSDDVIVRPRPVFCERNPENCDSSCDSSSYLCQNLPVCGNLLGRTRCCSYFPKASESLRLMLEYCESYTSLYWSFMGEIPPYDQVVNYGIRIDFDMPVTTDCLRCQDGSKGGGTCGFSSQYSKQFLCLCDKANVSTYCDDYRISHHGRAGFIAGTSISVSISGIIIAGVWYVKKMRSSKPVNFGVQNNENRVF